jgi:hypothetical protein
MRTSNGTPVQLPLRVETFSEDDIESQAKLLRQASQEAGISNHEPWEAISDRRRESWRRVAKGLLTRGYSVQPLKVGLLDDGKLP